MLKDLTLQQQELAEYMSNLSEEAYCAGWIEGLEYALWELLLGLRGDYGRLLFTEEHGARLRYLASACGGWIVFDEKTEETWIPAIDWDQRFSVWRENSI